MLETSRQWPKARRQAGTGFSLKATLLTPWFRLLVCKTVTEYGSFVLSHPACGNLLLVKKGNGGVGGAGTGNCIALSSKEVEQKSSGSVNMMKQKKHSQFPRSPHFPPLWLPGPWLALQTFNVSSLNHSLPDSRGSSLPLQIFPCAQTSPRGQLIAELASLFRAW